MIEPGERIGFGGAAIAEPPDQAFARHIHQIADGLQPEPGEQQLRIIVEPQRRHRKRSKRARQRSGIEHQRSLPAVMRQRPGRPRSGRDRGAAGIALHRKAALDCSQQRRFAIEQMRGTRGIEQCAVGSVDHAPWSPALRGERDPFERAGIALVIGGQRHEAGREHPRIGQPHSRLRTRFGGERAGGIDHRAMRGLGNQHDRFERGIAVTPPRGVPAPAVDREVGEPQRDDDPAHAATRHVRG